MALSHQLEVGQGFSELPECHGGWMMRQHPQSGEIFEPSTVEDKVDIAANSRICIPVVIDVVKREMIWADLALSQHVSWGGNNVESNQKGMVLMGKALTDIASRTSTTC